MRTAQIGLGRPVVVDLTFKLPLDLHFQIHADNFFSSQDQQPRNDCREVLTLMIILLAKKPQRDKGFQASDPMHQAHWITKAIYSLKI